MNNVRKQPKVTYAKNKGFAYDPQSGLPIMNVAPIKAKVELETEPSFPACVELEALSVQPSKGKNEDWDGNGLGVVENLWRTQPKCDDE
jgi:hypothetical protein